MDTRHSPYYHINSPLIRRFLTFAVLMFVWAFFPAKGFGADVTLAWDANSESDLAGYIVHWGTASGAYSHSKDVGNTTRHTITGLQDGITYYFAATAYDIDDYKSDYSKELVHVVGSPNQSSHMITASANSNGSITPSGAVTVAGGTDQTFTISADLNYEIMDVLVDGVSVGAVASHTFNNVTDDHVIAVSFVALTLDSDGDGVPDYQDAFPIDPDESLDTDGDGEGNNADTDDDNDGMPDTWELAYGLNPLIDDAAGDLDGDEVTNIDEYNLGTKPDYYEGNFKPDTPVLFGPEDSATVGLTPLLETEEFYDPNINDVHSKTQWKIMQAYDDACVFDVTTAGSLTSMTIPKQILAEDTVYIWQVRFIDNHDTPSEWSEEREFTTDFSENDTNNNGIPDDQEVPDTLDLDEDGTMDNDQSDIKCVSVERGSTQICISIRDAENAVSIVSLEAEDPRDPQLASKTEGKPNFIEFGLLNFKVLVNNPGDETLMTIYLSKSAFEDGNCFKYDPVDGVWLDYSDYTDFSPNRKEVYLTIKDGGFGDADGIANGIIIDPLAFGSESDPNGGSNDTPIEDIVDGLSCFISTAAAHPDDRERHSWSLWREIRGREMAIIFVIVVIAYLGKVVFSRDKSNGGLI